MKDLILEKMKVYRVELPEQTVTRKYNGRPVAVTTTETKGSHRCIAVVVDEDGQWAIVVPLTSAQDSQGGEKHKRPTWVRMIHDGRPVYAMAEQIRMVDRSRVFDQEGFISNYDQEHLEKKLTQMFNFKS